MVDKSHMLGVGGGAPKIEMSAAEITNLFNQLQRIVVELETNALSQIDNIDRTTFYKAGKAQAAINVHTDANNKIIELYNHYQRAQTLLMETLEKMIVADQAIASQIIERLEI